MTAKKSYTPEFKLEAVRLAEKSDNKRAVARDLGLHLSMLRRWKQQLDGHGERAFPGKGIPRDEERARLKRENARLQQENAILKKAVGSFSKGPHSAVS